MCDDDTNPTSDRVIADYLNALEAGEAPLAFGRFSSVVWFARPAEWRTVGYEENVVDPSNTNSAVRRANAIGGLGAIAVGILLLIAVTTAPITVPAGYRGVKIRFGKVTPRALRPGLHFKLPLVEKVIDVDVREKKVDLETSASSKDLQTVQSKIAVNYHPDPTKVDSLYDDVGLEYSIRVLEPAVEETVKAVTAQYTAEELITKRTEVRDVMEDLLQERLDANHLKITKFNIVNFEFSVSFKNQ